MGLLAQCTNDTSRLFHFQVNSSFNITWVDFHPFYPPSSSTQLMPLLAGLLRSRVRTTRRHLRSQTCLSLWFVLVHRLDPNQRVHACEDFIPSPWCDLSDNMMARMSSRSVSFELSLA